VLAAGHDLARLSAGGRHRLRILAKRQRYALELLAPLASGEVPARALKMLSRLQQSLGEVNDIQVVLSVLPSLTASRKILDRAESWARRQVRRSLPKAAAQLQRLHQRGFER
jgi:CHAD domain-containing protein